jgi:hypothetical protein
LKPGPKCHVCRDPRRAEIERDAIISIRPAAEHFGLPYSNLYKHMKHATEAALNGRPPPLAMAMAVPVDTFAKYIEDALKRAECYEKKLRQIGEEALTAREYRAAVQGFRGALDALEPVVRLAGIRDRDRQRQGEQELTVEQIDIRIRQAFAGATDEELEAAGLVRALPKAG